MEDPVRSNKGEVPDIGLDAKEKAELEEATRDSVSILGKIKSGELLAKMRILMRDPQKGAKLLDYLAGRAKQTDEHGWVVNLMALGADFGAPQAMIDEAIDRLGKRFGKK